MDTIITDEIIKENYNEIIEGLILNNDYVSERFAISLIRTILECGVNRFDFDMIKYICMKVIDIKNLKNDKTKGYDSFKYASNSTIIKEAIRLYNDKMDEDFNNKNHNSR